MCEFVFERNGEKWREIERERGGGRFSNDAANSFDI